MKKFLCTVFAAVTITCLFTGCQQTPDSPVVMGKNQEQMMDTAENGGENYFSLSLLETPERFIGDWSGVDDCVTVHADADIELPTVQAVPTGTVERRSFTQDDADRMLAVFIGDSPFYEEQAYIKQDVLELLELLQAVQRGEIPLSEVDEDVTMEEIPAIIEYLAELARTAPDENDRVPASRTFEPQGDNGEIIEGCTEVDGNVRHLWIHNWPGTSGDLAGCYVEGYGGRNNSYAIPYSMLDEIPEGSISEEDAIRAGDELIESLGFVNVICDESTQVAYVKDYYNRPVGSTPEIVETGYELQYVRCLDGLPISYTPIRGINIPENENYAGSWEYECITVGVTGSGIVYFAWSSPYTEPVMETQDTQLLKFQDVADIFGKMIIVKNSYLKESNARNGTRTTIDFDVDHVELSLMRIRSNGNFSQGVLVPVWDFWGTRTMYPDVNTQGEVQYTVLLTINAIDGTIIEREYGY